LKGQDEELTSILSKYPFLMDWNEEYKTPLHYAIDGNHLSTCELLLDFGAGMVLKLSIFYLFLNRLERKLGLLSNQKIFKQSFKILRNLMPLIFSQ